MTVSSGDRAERVSADTLIELRRRVLRNNEADAVVTDPRDGDADALHLAVYRKGQLVAGGSFYSSPSPVASDERSMQLRFLATDSLVQHSGAGSLLLRAAESELTTRRVTHLWANGRDTALGFYDKCGWTRVAGSEHLSKETGLPHTVITRALVDPRAVRLDWATQRDVHACASLREEMYFALNWRDFGTDWIVESARHFADGITNNLLVAAVARTDDGEVVALAAAALREAPPLPRHPLGRVAYVHSVSVRPRFRHRGLARQLMTMLVEELDARAIERVELHATDFGYEIYEQMGFVIRTHSPEMRLNLREILFD